MINFERMRFDLMPKDLNKFFYKCRTQMSSEMLQLEKSNLLGQIETLKAEIVRLKAGLIGK